MVHAAFATTQIQNTCWKETFRFLWRNSDWANRAPGQPPGSTDDCRPAAPQQVGVQRRARGLVPQRTQRRMAQQAARSGGPWASWTAPSPRHCSWVQHRRPEHINRVFKNDGKGRGCQNATYHPMLMNWAIAFLARTSSGTYNEVAKIFMLPHISTVYQKTAEMIKTKND